MYLVNLLRSIKQLVMRSRDLVTMLLNIDRFGNAICGGDYRATISARVGYFSIYKNNVYWLSLQWIINAVFYPLDGPGHCYQAYQWEKGKNYRRGNDIALSVLSILVLISCLLLAPIIRAISFYRRKRA